MRLFIAFDIPEEIKTALSALQFELRHAHADVAWAKPDNLHLTLKFLGEVEESRLAEISDVCRNVAGSYSPLTLAIQDTGAFPNLKEPRVLWAGLAGQLAELRALQAQLETQLEQAGFPKEERSFKAHLTLGRVKSLKNAAQLMTRLVAYRLPTLTFMADELILMKSQLAQGGSIYTPLEKFDLSK